MPHGHEPSVSPNFQSILLWHQSGERQLGCAARGFAKTVRTHEQALAVLGTGFMKRGLLGIGAIVRKLVLGRTLRLHRLQLSYASLVFT